MTEPTAAHPVPDEDPEQHIGAPVPDPWSGGDIEAREVQTEVTEDGSVDSGADPGRLAQ